MKYKNGVRMSCLAVLFGMPKKTIYLLILKIKKVYDIAKRVTFIFKQRAPIFEKVENLLLIYTRINELIYIIYTIIYGGYKYIYIYS